MGTGICLRAIRGFYSKVFLSEKWRLRFDQPSPVVRILPVHTLHRATFFNFLHWRISLFQNIPLNSFMHMLQVCNIFYSLLYFVFSFFGFGLFTEKLLALGFWKALVSKRKVMVKNDLVFGLSFNLYGLKTFKFSNFKPLLPLFNSILLNHHIHSFSETLVYPNFDIWLTWQSGSYKRFFTIVNQKSPLRRVTRLLSPRHSLHLFHLYSILMLNCPIFLDFYSVHHFTQILLLFEGVNWLVIWSGRFFARAFLFCFFLLFLCFEHFEKNLLRFLISMDFPDGWGWSCFVLWTECALLNYVDSHRLLPRFHIWHIALKDHLVPV